MSLDVLTFGCRLNAYESEIMRKRAEDAGLSDAIIVNSCAVTGEAVRQSRQAIRKAKRDNPDKRIIVSGCAAQTNPEEFAEMSEVDLVIGNQEKLTEAAYRDLPAPAAEFGVGLSEKVRVADIMAVREMAPHLEAAYQDRTRAFVQVQNGCDHRCTFCIIPYGRGNSRSVPAGAVVDEARRLVELGYREIVLTGVDITSWGGDLPGSPKLGALVTAILKHVPELDRLRLSSIDSIEVDDKLLRVIAEEERLMPHLHLSLQAGDDLTLKRMKRRHLRDDAIRFCETARRLRPDITFGADLIAGFPTETEAMFQNSLRLVDECGLTFLHVFPFSPRTGTAAARMPQLDRRLVKERAARLRQKGTDVEGIYLASQIGEIRPVLIENPGQGRTPHFVPVSIMANDGERGETGGGLATSQPGQIVMTRLTQMEGRRLIGQPMRQAA